MKSNKFNYPQLPGVLAGEVSRGSRGGVGDLEPGVLPDDGGVHRLDRDVLRVQVQAVHQAL